MVEAPGVEPGSRNVSRRASTGIVRSLKPRSAPTDRIRSTVASSISPQRPLAGSSSASPVKWPSVRSPGHAAGEGAPVLGSQCEVVVRSQNFCRCLRRPPDNLHLPHDVPSSGRNRFAPDRTALTVTKSTIFRSSSSVCTILKHIATLPYISEMTPKGCCSKLIEIIKI